MLEVLAPFLNNAKMVSATARNLLPIKSTQGRLHLNANCARVTTGLLVVRSLRNSLYNALIFVRKKELCENCFNPTTRWNPVQRTATARSLIAMTSIRRSSIQMAYRNDSTSIGQNTENDSRASGSNNSNSEDCTARSMLK